MPNMSNLSILQWASWEALRVYNREKGKGEWMEQLKNTSISTTRQAMNIRYQMEVKLIWEFAKL